jgi:hypothetical protein
MWLLKCPYIPCIGRHEKENPIKITMCFTELIVAINAPTI